MAAPAVTGTDLKTQLPIKMILKPSDIKYIFKNFI